MDWRPIEEEEKLTLSKDNVVLLDVRLEGVLLQLFDIRSGGNSRRSEEPEGIFVDTVHFESRCNSKRKGGMVSCRLDVRGR